MNIIELANTVEDGDEVRREGWGEQALSIVFKTRGAGYGESFVIQNTNMLYEMDRLDLTATDWYIVKKESKATLALKEFNSGKPLLTSQVEIYRDYFMAAWNAALETLRSEIWYDDRVTERVAVVHLSTLINELKET